MTTSHPSAAALATELSYLIDLPVEQRGPAEGARYDQVRWALADIDPADRMAAYAAAVAAIDPDRLLGPYPNPATPLTHELYAFETWRLGDFYYGELPLSDAARRLLMVTDPIFHSYTHLEIYEYSVVRTMLGLREITPEVFPGFSLRDFLHQSGTDMAAWDAAAAACTRAWGATTCEPATAS